MILKATTLVSLAVLVFLGNGFNHAADSKPVSSELGTTLSSDYEDSTNEESNLTRAYSNSESEEEESQPETPLPEDCPDVPTYPKRDECDAAHDSESDEDVWEE